MSCFSKIVIGFSFIFYSHNLMAQTSSVKEALAIKSANEWLSLLDRKDYRQSWEAMATLFKSKVKEKDWEKTAIEVRSPLGAFISRKLKTKIFTTSLPGASDGEYVVIQYETQFQNRKNMIETVTPMMDDSKWRVSGYFIK